MRPNTQNANVVGEQIRSPECQTYTVSEAAEILGICRAVAYRKGVLPTVQIGGRRLVPKQALEKMLTDTRISDERVKPNHE